MIYDLPKVGFTDPVPLEKGFIQGRIDAPPRFRIFLGWVLKPVIRWWQEANYGIREGHRGGKLLNRVVWADNVWIFATCPGMYQAMIDMFTGRLEQAKPK